MFDRRLRPSTGALATLAALAGSLTATHTTPGTLEMRNTRCNLALLSQIAQRTGGAVLTPTGLEAALSHLEFSPEVSETVSQQPLWTRWIILWIFIGLLTLEWGVRKLLGMA